MMPSGVRFDIIDEFLEKAEASEVTHVENKQPQQPQQQQQQLQQQKQPTDSSFKASKRRYRLAISVPANTTHGKTDQFGSHRHGKSGSEGQTSGLLPAPWVSTENFKDRCSTGKSLGCRTLNHMSSFCPNYSL